MPNCKLDFFRRHASPAPKANENLDKAKFYTKTGKSEKRPGFGRQSECDCWALGPTDATVSIVDRNSADTNYGFHHPAQPISFYSRGQAQERCLQKLPQAQGRRAKRRALFSLNPTLAQPLQAATCVFVSSNIVQDVVSTGPNRAVSLLMHRAFSPPSWRPFRKAP